MTGSSMTEGYNRGSPFHTTGGAIWDANPHTKKLCSAHKRYNILQHLLNY